MRIHLIAIGERMPAWVRQGYEEYAKRLPPETALQLAEIAPPKRLKSADPARLVAEEGARMLAAVPRGALVIALDERGRAWTTLELAQQLEGWLQSGRDVALVVGGPDGLAPECRSRADLVWSLSRLTLPHPLVRVVIAEQLYRAWTILRNHPYHRA
jgi:23S rRNA (pseudouridine1915-N3)-methyltransferase